jgi:DNA-binding GntR family transcriptional regulator
MSDTASAARVYETLKHRIVRWELQPGTRLVEAELAEQLGVSRTPVREALQRLRADGLAVARGRRGNEVPEWGRQEIEDSQRVRAHVESWAGRVAVERLGPHDLVDLRALAAAMHAEWAGDQPDLDRIAELNTNFHAVINRAAANSAIDQLLARATHLPILHRVFHVYSREQTSTALVEHDTIIRAIESGDPDWVESIIKAHILAALPALLSH